ncbi:bath-40 [Symbiodinium sp. CCMP2456]|nr:bath-40 [Symbiodinium sp. CCMP2456]
MSAGSKRKREPELMVADENLSAASDMWKKCFGKDGNFTVIVEELSGEAHQDTEGKLATKRTEFKVWSSLLAQWSPVFEKMVGSDSYAESQRAEVVIQDFSAGAVELFLRFMYSGSIGGSIAVVVEVAALADKYQVKALHASCLQIVRDALKPDIACEVLASADRLHVDDLRAAAFDLILMKPEAALKERPSLRPELLEEILGSGLLCVSAEVLRKTLRSWGRKDCDSLEAAINIRAHNEYTTDALFRLSTHYEHAGKIGIFMGCWVVAIVGPEQGKVMNEQDLRSIACNDKPFSLRKGWVQWFLPQAWVHLLGFSFEDSSDYDYDGEIKASSAVSFLIWSSADGASWHLTLESHKREIYSSTFMHCKRPPTLVKYFKLEVLEGELVNIYFNIHGILQTSIVRPS